MKKMKNITRVMNDANRSTNHWCYLSRWIRVRIISNSPDGNYLQGFHVPSNIPKASYMYTSRWLALGSIGESKYAWLWFSTSTYGYISWISLVVVQCDGLISCFCPIAVVCIQSLDRTHITRLSVPGIKRARSSSSNTRYLSMEFALISLCLLSPSELTNASQRAVSPGCSIQGYTCI